MHNRDQRTVALPSGVEQTLYTRLGFVIESRGRFIHYKHSGSLKENSGYGQFLALSTGEVVALAANLKLHSDSHNGLQ